MYVLTFEMTSTDINGKNTYNPRYSMTYKHNLAEIVKIVESFVAERENDTRVKFELFGIIYSFKDIRKKNIHDKHYAKRVFGEIFEYADGSRETYTYYVEYLGKGEKY